jgi:hypothetical protein
MQIGIDSFTAAYDESSRAVPPSNRSVSAFSGIAWKITMRCLQRSVSSGIRR